MMRIFFGILWILLAGHVWAQKEMVEAGLERVFKEREMEGCFVVLNPVTDTLHVYHPERAKRRFLPASTFKIPCAVIGLDTGAVKDVDEVIPYGGTTEWIKDWERDMDLKEAMKLSNVAIFHQVAKRVGMERMKAHLHLFEYGNQQTGGESERRFWLEGPLEISALEQVDFLRRLVGGMIPVKEETLASLKVLTLYERRADAVIYGKTGWSGTQGEQIGWWVGWVEKEGRIYPFALNARTPSMEAAKKRIPAALDCLKALGIW